MRNFLTRTLTYAIVLVLALAYVVKFGGPSFLQLYIRSGIGDCVNLPLLCRVPEKEIKDPALDKEFLGQMIPYSFEDMQVSLPREFAVVKQNFSKLFYKKPGSRRDSVIYLLCEKPNFFVNLFPVLKRKGITNDYEFWSKAMRADYNKTKSLLDLFFIIIKSIFTPCTAGQADIRLLAFETPQHKGFITYSLSKRSNLFDCNMVNTRGEYFKIYIKDIRSQLHLKQIFTIISTVRGKGHSSQMHTDSP